MYKKFLRKFIKLSNFYVNEAYTYSIIKNLIFTMSINRIKGVYT